MPAYGFGASRRSVQPNVVRLYKVEFRLCLAIRKLTVCGTNFIQNHHWAATNELVDAPDFVTGFEAAKKDVADGKTFRWEDIKREV